MLYSQPQYDIICKGEIMIKIITKNEFESELNDFDIIFTDQKSNNKKEILIKTSKDLYHNLDKVTKDNNIALIMMNKNQRNECYQLLYFYQNYLSKIDIFKEKLNEINNTFHKEHDSRYAYDAIEKLKYMNCDGKFLRAFLITVGYELKHENIDYIIPLAIAYETFQTSILIHDDIIDDADTRRGKKTIPELYKKQLNINNSVPSSLAMCIGDLGFYLTNEIIFNYYRNDKKLVKYLEYLNKIIINTIKGEIADVYLPAKETFEGEKKFTELEIMEIARLKTSWYTVVGPFCLGAIAAGAKDDKIKKYEYYLEPMGMAFQIRDDILGIYGNSDKTGKPNTSDIKEKKLTLMYSYLRTIKTEYFKEFAKYYGKEDVTEKEVEKIREIIKESGALLYADSFVEELLKITKDEVVKYKNKHIKDILIGLMVYIKLREK